MGEGLKKKLGPLPVWAWGAIAGVGVGAFILWRKAKEKESTEGSLPVPSSFAASPPAGSAEGGGGGGTPAEVKAPEQAPRNETGPSSTSGTPQALTPIADFVTELGELRAAGFKLPGENSAAPATAAARQAASGGTPGRGGASFKAGAYKGHAAHIYSKAVPGGVGPGKNIIVLNPGHTQKQAAKHSATPQHAPAHVKGSTTHHTAAKPKPPARHSAAPKKQKAKRKR